MERVDSLKIEAHPRGHVALCNGRIDNISARAVPAAHETKYNAMIMANHVEKLSNMAYQEKQKNLKAFRRQVQKRVSSRERAKEFEIQLQSGNAVAAEHGVIQRGNFMMPKAAGDSHAQQRPDVEDMCIATNTGNAISIHQVQDVQLARKKLASKKKDLNMSELPGGVWHSDSGDEASQPASNDDDDDDDGVGGGNLAGSTSNVDYTVITTSSPVRYVQTASAATTSVSTQHYSSAPSKATALSTYSSLRKVEEEKRKHAASQYLLHRQLFSDMERQQVRDAKKLAEHTKRLQKIRENKESERLRIEQAEAAKFGQYDDDSSSEDTSHEEKMEQWATLLAIEEHKRKIQKAKETDRYIQALHQQLRERVEQKCYSIPPLCSCGPTIWDTNPNTCANNCIFYKNPKGYVKALTSVLIHLDSSSARNKHSRR